MAIRPHAFVAMPFKVKPGPDGHDVDYDRVYRELIVPAIEAAGLSAFRADQETAAGSIVSDMFQELLIADLVVADLSIANPNVWYEIGVRHALRSRGVVLLFGGSAPSAFDLYTDRKVRYGLSGDGPDPLTLERDIAALATTIRSTMATWHDKRISPVYDHLPQLQEPDWKSLRVGDVKAFWARHEAWERRIDLARQQRRIGDLMVLADEGPVAAFRCDAWARAGKALRQAGEYRLALEVLEQSLAIEPERVDAGREKGMCLQRLALVGESGHSLARARQHYETMLQSRPADVETLALLGRIDKDAWVAAWRRPGSDAATMRDDAQYDEALLAAAIASYRRAFCSNPAHCFSGINAVTLMHLARHLGLPYGTDHALDVMTGAVRFAAENASSPDDRYWSAATLGDLEVLSGSIDAVRSAYKVALAVPGVDWFALHSSRDQLLLLQDLGFRPDAVSAALAVFDRQIQRMTRPDEAWRPRQVLLFSGHMMDRPDRESPRFPPGAELLAGMAVRRALDELQAGPEDRAWCQAAAGGDILFLEACQARGVRCDILLPFEEPEFVQRSVIPAAHGEDWVRRFHKVCAGPATTVHRMPEQLGPVPPGVDPFERCNLWLLHSALADGVDKLRFVALWDGAGAGDGAGGTAHMVEQVRQRSTRLQLIDMAAIVRDSGAT